MGDGPIIAKVACSGTEVQVMDCVFNVTHGCVHDDDVTLRCTATGTGNQEYSINFEMLLFTSSSPGHLYT